MTLNPGVNRIEFKLLIVMLMSIGAMAIDIMLPALPAIANDLGASNLNDQQLILTYFMAGFGVSQLFYGPISDSFGRKPVMLAGIFIFLLPVVLAPQAQDYQSILYLRFLQGLGAGAARVLTTAIIRDSMQGRAMARFMSLVFVIYMAVPIIAPTIGQFLIELISWHATFYFMAISAVIASIWAIVRMPETLPPEVKRKFAPKDIIAGFKIVLSNKRTISFSCANALIFGSLIGFLGISPQIYLDIYHLGQLYPLMIALTAFSLAIAALLNAKLVLKYGPETLTIVATIGFIVFSLIWVLLAWQIDVLPFWLFVGIHQLAMLCFGVAAPNQITVAIQPLGNVAGTASSTIGFIHTAGGALIGATIGTFYNGTLFPVALGFFICGCLALTLMQTAKQKTATKTVSV